MSPEDRAKSAIRAYVMDPVPMTMAERVEQAIRDAEKDAYQAVLSILQEHKKTEAFVSLDELTEQIRGLLDVPSVA